MNISRKCTRCNISHGTNNTNDLAMRDTGNLVISPEKTIPKNQTQAGAHVIKKIDRPHRKYLLIEKLSRCRYPRKFADTTLNQ